MPAFATVEDFATTSAQKDLSAEETATVTSLLDEATQVIKDEVGQVLEAVASESVTLWAARDGHVILPQIPVTAVTSVTVDGVLRTVNTDYDWNSAGVVTLFDTAAPVGAPSTSAVLNRKVVVVYSHGYATIPHTLKALCKALAARAFSNPYSLVGQATLNSSASFSDAGAMSLTDREKRMLDRYRP